MRSCGTMVLDGHIIESHVPASDIKRCSWSDRKSTPGRSQRL
ncbi:DUF411 domain-containing protein [Aurantiacibacter hainanensis]